MTKIIRLTVLTIIAVNCLTLGMIFFTQPVWAAENTTNDNLTFTPEVSIPDQAGNLSTFTENKPYALDQTTGPICEYILAIYKYAIGIVAIIAAVTMIIGGVIWITAAGSPARVSLAKDWIANSLLGILLALASFLLLATINPELTICQHIAIDTIKPKEDDLGVFYNTDYGEWTSIDKSNNFWCCVIRGDLESGGLAWDPDQKACNTLEVTSRDKAQKYCNNLYDIFSKKAIYNGLDPWTNIKDMFNVVFSSEITRDLKLETRDAGAKPGEKNTASIYQGKCSEVTTEAFGRINDWCRASNAPDYCAIKEDGDSCRVTKTTQGYCKNKQCIPCLKNFAIRSELGQKILEPPDYIKNCHVNKIDCLTLDVLKQYACTDDYQCPDQRYVASPSTKCGNVEMDIKTLSNEYGECQKFIGGLPYKTDKGAIDTENISVCNYNP